MPRHPDCHLDCDGHHAAGRPCMTVCGVCGIRRAADAHPCRFGAPIMCGCWGGPLPPCQPRRRIRRITR